MASHKVTCNLSGTSLLYKTPHTRFAQTWVGARFDQWNSMNMPLLRVKGLGSRVYMRGLRRE